MWYERCLQYTNLKLSQYFFKFLRLALVVHVVLIEWSLVKVEQHFHIASVRTLWRTTVCGCSWTITDWSYCGAGSQTARKDQRMSRSWSVWFSVILMSKGKKSLTIKFSKSGKGNLTEVYFVSILDFKRYSHVFYFPKIVYSFSLFVDTVTAEEASHY